MPNLGQVGTIGSGSFAANVERVGNWRETILLMFPNGDAPLVALTSMLRAEKTNDASFNWFEEGMFPYRAIITGASTTISAVPASGADISAADATTVVALRVKPDGGSDLDVSIFKAGHMLYNQVSDEMYWVLKVDRTNGFLVVERNQGTAGGNGVYTMGVNDPAITGDQTTGDTIIISGSGFPEGAPISDAISVSPSKYSNNCQIFRNVVSITRTARKTRLRWDPQGAYKEKVRQALQAHSTEMERAFFWGRKRVATAASNPDVVLSGTSTGAPMRLTQGIIPFLPTITTTSVSVHTDLTVLEPVTDASGTATGGLSETIWDGWLENLFRFGSAEKTVFLGSTALNVLNQMAKNKFTIEAVPTDKTYGMQIQRMISPFGILNLIQHPLMSHDPVWRRDMVAVDMEKLVYRFVTDTELLENRQNPGDDQTKDEFLTEAGLEINFNGSTPDSDSPSSVSTPFAHGRLKGVGVYVG